MQGRPGGACKWQSLLCSCYGGQRALPRHHSPTPATASPSSSSAACVALKSAAPPPSTAPRSNQGMMSAPVRLSGMGA